MPIKFVGAQDKPISVYDDRVGANTEVIRTNTGTIMNNTKTLIQNTQKIINNSDRIAKILSGDLYGAQYESKLAAKKMVDFKSVLRTMTNNILKFAAFGFGGGPAFIYNIAAYLQSTEDKAVDSFVTATTSDKDLNVVCDPYQNEVKRSLAEDYDPFTDEIKCTADITKIDKFSSGDFIGSGGWDTWLDVTTNPKNNRLGAMTLAKAELDERIEAQTVAATMEANQGDGFMSWKKCSTSTSEIDMDRGFDGCTTVTPGSIIANKVKWADTSSLREMEIAGDFNNISYVWANRAAQYTNLGTLSQQNNGLLGNEDLRLFDPSSPNYINSTRNNYLNYLDTLPIPYDPYNPPNVPYNGNDSNRTINVSQLNNQDGTPNLGLILNIIEAQMAIETSYKNVQNNIYSTLESVKTAFVDSSTCEGTALTAITNKIDGEPPYDHTDPANLSWNKNDALNAMVNTDRNKLALEALKTALSAQNVSTETISASIVGLSTITPLSSNSMITNFTGPEGSSYIQMVNWLLAKGRTCGLN